MVSRAGIPILWKSDRFPYYCARSQNIAENGKKLQCLQMVHLPCSSLPFHPLVGDDAQVEEIDYTVFVNAPSRDGS
jgi:hypothetical protein